MPRPASIAAAPTPEKLDTILDQADAGCDAIVTAWEVGGDDADPRKEEDALLALLAQLRDLIRSFLREHEAGRPGLSNVFGEDAGRRVRVRTVFEKANELIREESRGGSDGKWYSAIAVWESLEHALSPPETAEPMAKPFQGGSASAQETSAATNSAKALVDPGAGDEDSPGSPGIAQAGLPQAGSQPQAATQAPQGGPQVVPEIGFPSFQPPARKDSKGAASKVVTEAPPRDMRGETTLENGVKYTGEWCGHVRDGEGVELRPDGSSYMGQFVMGQAHGKGIYTQPDGLTIAGHWNGGKLNGSGLESHPDGTTYEGQYNDGVKSGFGTYTYEEGSVYEGQFNNDGMHGNGIYISANGDHGGRYQGEWNENRMHGTGLFKVPDGRMYDGEYAYDRRNGSGTFTWPDGRVHEGQWRAGKMHGVGRAVFPDGNEKLGEWQDGKLLRWDEHGNAISSTANPTSGQPPQGSSLRAGAAGAATRGPPEQAAAQPAVTQRLEQEQAKKKKEFEEMQRLDAERKEKEEADRKHREMMAFGEQQAAKLATSSQAAPAAGMMGMGGHAGDDGPVDDDPGAGGGGGHMHQAQGQWRPPDEEDGEAEVPRIPE